MKRLGKNVWLLRPLPERYVIHQTYHSVLRFLWCISYHSTYRLVGFFVLLCCLQSTIFRDWSLYDLWEMWVGQRHWPCIARYRHLKRSGKLFLNVPRPTWKSICRKRGKRSVSSERHGLLVIFMYRLNLRCTLSSVSEGEWWRILPYGIWRLIYIVVSMKLRPNPAKFFSCFVFSKSTTVSSSRLQRRLSKCSVSSSHISHTGMPYSKAKFCWSVNILVQRAQPEICPWAYLQTRIWKDQ